MLITVLSSQMLIVAIVWYRMGQFEFCLENTAGGNKE